MMPPKILALIFAWLILGVSSGRATEVAVIKVSLYHAINAPPPADAMTAPDKLQHRLQAVFGFKHYVLIKSENIELTKNWEQWAVPRKDYFIRIEPLPTAPGAAQLVDYEIYKDGFLLVQGKYEPHKGKPLFTNGPTYKQGLLVFVLDAK
jgi:hypothetical protein